MPTWLSLTLVLVLSTPVVLGLALIVFVRRLTQRRQHARVTLRKRQ
jgi:hypothetical protein